MLYSNLYRNLVYRVGQEFLDVQYQYAVVVFYIDGPGVTSIQSTLALNAI